MQFLMVSAIALELIDKKLKTKVTVIKFLFLKY